MINWTKIPKDFSPYIWRTNTRLLNYAREMYSVEAITDESEVDLMKDPGIRCKLMQLPFEKVSVDWEDLQKLDVWQDGKKMDSLTALTSALVRTYSTWQVACPFMQMIPLRWNALRLHNQGRPDELTIAVVDLGDTGILGRAEMTASVSGDFWNPMILLNQKAKFELYEGTGQRTEMSERTGKPENWGLKHQEHSLCALLEHEWGHILGLDHSTNTNSVMHPLIGYLEKRKSPTNLDVENLRKLYYGVW